ncbi:MAG: hypothetical protein AAF702_26010 [Chloroflexota bacterium]
MMTKNITKIIVAVALTLAVTFGSGIIEKKIGLDVTPSVYAGNCGLGGGGGC